MSAARRTDQEFLPLFQSPGATSSGLVDTRLCDVCFRIVQHIPGDGLRTHEFVKETSSQETTAFCQLCNLISSHQWSQRYDGNGKVVRISLPEERYPPYSISVLIEPSERVGSVDNVSKVSISLKSADAIDACASFAVWADGGTPAAKKIVTSVPILIENVRPISGLVRGWLHECMTYHQDCVYSQASSAFVDDLESDLPTRLLEVVGTVGSLTVRLVETRGRKGRYCALSHCWGAIELSPLKTTKENVRRHLANISLEELPLTFRQVVDLICGIRIRYVWIDSLCIIQDDHEDWAREARVMGMIYQSAVLVIAAAASFNSTQGLLVTERPTPVTLRVPYFSNGVIRGSFNLTTAPEYSHQPAYSPLSERAWAFQEWYLARRIVFFMPSGPIWRCREKTLDEYGSHQSTNLFEHISWLSFLKSYSDKKLTVKSDRLIAIQGIVNEMQKTRKSRFSYGVWEDRLTEQLLWRAFLKSGNASGEPLDLPSWCWASTGSEKLWLPHFADEVTTITEAIRISNSGSLVVTANLMGSLFSENKILDCCVFNMRRQIHHLERIAKYTKFDEDAMLPRSFGDFHPTHLIGDRQCPHPIIGLAVFDEGKLIQNAFCSLLASSHRKATDLLPFTSDLESQNPEISRTARDQLGASDSQELDAIELSQTERLESVDISKEDLQLQTSEVHTASDRLMSVNEHSNASKCIDFLHTFLSDHVYWALLLEPVDGKAKFKRVGLAMLHRPSVDMNKEDLTEFEIV